MPYAIALHRIQDAVHEAPGKAARVLIDRLWPRGLRKDALGDIQWLHDASPDADLRKGLHSGEITPKTFQSRYRQQLKQSPDALLPLMKLVRQGELQLLTATRDPQTSYLTVLRQVLLEALDEEDRECDDRESSSPVCYAHLEKDKP